MTERAEKAEEAVKAATKRVAPKKTTTTKKKAAVKKKATPKKKAAAKATSKQSAPDLVFSAVEKAPADGIDNATLSKETGLAGKKLANAVYRLKKQGLIISPKRGVYKTP